MNSFEQIFKKACGSNSLAMQIPLRLRPQSLAVSAHTLHALLEIIMTIVAKRFHLAPIPYFSQMAFLIKNSCEGAKGLRFMIRCALIVFSAFMCFSFTSCRQADPPEQFLFFLHGRFYEDHTLGEYHSKYGPYAYQDILNTFQASGLEVISERRASGTNALNYAHKVTGQIDSLIALGVRPANITVVGTSKGGYIAQYVSTLAKNPALNFVFVACYQDSDLEHIPEIEYCGNILTIYEKTDPFGVSALARKETSTLSIPKFEEIEINTGLGHGFIFQPLAEWIQPTIQWAKNKSL